MKPPCAKAQEKQKQKRETGKKKKEERKRAKTKHKKNEKPTTNVLAHELIASAISYLRLAPCRYVNLSNLSSRTLAKSSLVFL
jgi:hypothetical protein